MMLLVMVGNIGGAEIGGGDISGSDARGGDTSGGCNGKLQEMLMICIREIDRKVLVQSQIQQILPQDEGRQEIFIS